jgi:hypothetical protein
MGRDEAGLDSRLVPGSPIYHADARVQVQERGHPGPFVLEIHEMRDDGEPRCGPKPREWRGKPMDPVPLGPGSVTCQRCAQITDH